LQYKQKRSLFSPLVLLVFWAHSSHSVHFLRPISQFIAICLCTINPLDWTTCSCYFLCLCHCCYALWGRYCSDDSSLGRSLGGECLCENQKLGQNLSLGGKELDKGSLWLCCRKSKAMEKWPLNRKKI
jgi:hypothetical protein